VTVIPGVTLSTVADLAGVFKLLADETRLRILFYLMHEDELHVSALCKKLGQSQPAVSHHLAMLRDKELVKLRRVGKHNYYHLLFQRFEELLKTVFASIPEQERRFEFENYVLSFAPAEDALTV